MNLKRNRRKWSRVKVSPLNPPPRQQIETILGRATPYMANRPHIDRTNLYAFPLT
jgi:hypothetical protein